MVQAAPSKSSRGSRQREDTFINKVIAGRYRLEARIGEGGMLGYPFAKPVHYVNSHCLKFD